MAALSFSSRVKNRVAAALRRKPRLHPDWRAILRHDPAMWSQARAAAAKGPRVLIATSMGGFHAGAATESLLAVALTLRGASVEILLCDEFLPACQMAQIAHFAEIADYGTHGPTAALCRNCYRPARHMYDALGLKVHRYSEWVTREERGEAARLAERMPRAEIAAFRFRGMAAGEHALAGALRFFAKGVLDDTPEADAILRRYLAAAILTACAADRLFAEGGFETACFNHGIYVPQGLIGDAARARGVRVVNWNPAYRKQCFIFSHETTYHHTLMNEPTSVWENLPWTTAMEAQLTAYLESRWHGTQDWIWFHEKPRFALDEIARQIGVDFSKPCVGLLTNVVWDAQLHYPANAFANMLDWIIETIRYFARRPELQLLIRIHPAEIRGTVRSRQRVADEISRAFPELPRNVFVIGPDSDVSTYAAMSQCDSVIIYGTKTGVELASVGVPVVVAGEAWIRNKGVTLDAHSAAHYFELLDRLPLGKRMDEEAIRRARKYAFHFFFRRMIPLEMFAPAQGKTLYQVAIESIRELLPGRSRGLDVICEGILRDTAFVYPEEQMAQNLAEPNRL